MKPGVVVQPPAEGAFLFQEIVLRLSGPAVLFQGGKLSRLYG